MKRFKRIVPIILIICMLFSTTAFGAVKKPDKVDIISVEGSSAGITVKFKPQNGSVWYKLYYSEDEDFGYKSCIVNKTGSAFVSLDANKTYYVKMRAYKKVDGKKYWGKYSDVWTVTTKNSVPGMYQSIRKLTNNVFSLCLSPDEDNYPITLNLNSVYLFNDATGEILTKLNPDKFVNVVLGSEPTEYKKIEDDTLKVNSGYICVVGFNAKTGSYSSDETKYGIIFEGSYNNTDYIFKVSNHKMKFMKKTWVDGYIGN